MPFELAQSQLPYLNAVSVFIRAKPGSLENISKKFRNDWKKAWASDLNGFAPKDGLLVQKALKPERLWKVIEKEKISLLGKNDPQYPKKLNTICEPPFLLYVRGHAALLSSRCLAVVGTRRVTDYGRRCAKKLIEGLAGSDITIVSGLAFGIDTIALEAALTVGLKAVAVLGGGLDDATLYPPSNLKLAGNIIAAGGTVISEYPCGQHATKFSFPHRNRIISGLSQATLVIEADIKSGSLITARFAAEQGRDLMAVPGPISSQTSQGTNYLIQHGAALIASAADIMDALGMAGQTFKPEIKAENKKEKLVIDCLREGPKHIDRLAAETGLDLPTLNSVVIIMELNRKIKSISGDRFELNN